MKKMVLYRNNYIGPEILGHLLVFEDLPSGGSKLIFDCKTLELEWKNNARNVSCVPSGFYNIEFEKSNRFNRRLWELKGVPGRSEAKIHVANYYTQIQGCIAVGDMHTKINGDGFLDVRNSANTLSRLHNIMSSQSKSTIRIVGKT
ncbi:DUF5675 family protein [Tenacibaculum aquimarinum]|uniref:DUF5675 family protein n=1 Tax=Tenacibaculum aquimarinum TaxID=2910675 RepID=UPI001F0A1239|nr:DUF5675 family protein [Tenacibaculum aquimarinum]MCH3883425.1 DUF5675 family protein [Tenacibaculum aquimarinum]